MLRFLVFPGPKRAEGEYNGCVAGFWLLVLFSALFIFKNLVRSSHFFRIKSTKLKLPLPEHPHARLIMDIEFKKNVNQFCSRVSDNKFTASFCTN